ncbi:MAG: hypothetical protein HYT75_01385 [Deltaproteobacteria bacterium]|nr:hypothetical protein [Deltaproteobacteria bacterium]
MLEFYVYCKKYGSTNKFKIKDFNQLFERCKASLNKLADGGYLGFNNPSEREAFFVKLNNLKKEIESEQTAESETNQLFKRLYNSYVLVYLSLLELRRNPLHDEALKNCLQLSPSIVARDVHRIISELPPRVEYDKKHNPDQMAERLLYFLLSGGQRLAIIQIFRLQRFILDYCTHQELKNYAICKSFLKEGNHFCRAALALFEAFRDLGIEFHVGIRFFEKPPSDIDYEDAITIGLPVFSRFEPEGNKLILYKIVASNRGKYDGTVADLSFLGCKSDKFKSLNSKTILYCWYVV